MPPQPLTPRGSRLESPCSYQGGKHRIARHVVDHIAARARIDTGTGFFDLCCGSGAITIEMLNRGLPPERVTMVDLSSWGAVWEALGSGAFSLDRFREYVDAVPTDQHHIQAFAKELAATPASVDEPYKYLLLQACSFGGKQVWRDGDTWRNASFRDYWQPTATSSRRSPVNAMQPGSETLYDRVARLAEAMVGVRAIRSDVITTIGKLSFDTDAVVYVDPPYEGTTSYGFTLDTGALVQQVHARAAVPVFVSEGKPLGPDAVHMTPVGDRGGITGKRRVAHQEWVTLFTPATSARVRA